ncbi:MAG: hypothetical protein QM786_02340 [Breznakibacter sp.]
MSTFLFDEIIFGPVKSRRLGVSLGINLLPTDQKVCSFDCIYCECGINTRGTSKAKLPSRQEVKEKLRSKLAQMGSELQLPDVITFAGNGEPTLHPHFSDIVDDTLDLRNELCPSARIAVLSNATRLQNANVVEALKKVDDNILKLDSGLETSIMAIDRPNAPFKLDELVEQLIAFNGNLVIQTLFVRGEIDGKPIDNTSSADVLPWLGILKKVNPKSVMIYSISRDTPFDTLKKVPMEELNRIGQMVTDLGLEAQVSG